MTCFMRAEDELFLVLLGLMWVVDIDLVLCAGQKSLGFCGSIEIDLVFVWVVKINLISVWMELDLISV